MQRKIKFKTIRFIVLTGSSGFVLAHVKTVEIQMNIFIALKLSICSFKAK